MSLELSTIERRKRVRTCLEGLSLGDAFGQQFFCRQTWATARDSREIPPALWKYTDDTEMALGVAEVLVQRDKIDQDMLAEVFARRYTENPHRGYGSGAHEILTAINRGTPWRKAASQVFDGQGSMGNGAAMRVAPIGAWFADDLDLAAAQARLSAEITHLHPEGIAGALAVAVAGALAWQANQDPAFSRNEFFAEIIERTPPGLTRDGIQVAASLPADTWNHDAANRLGNGSRITSADTVPFCLWAAANHIDDFTEGLWAAVHVGGDIDTNCAIVGGILALAVGDEGLPSGWQKMREELAITGL